MYLYRLYCQLTCSSTLSELGKCDKEVGEAFLQSTYASCQWFLLVISVEHVDIGIAIFVNEL